MNGPSTVTVLLATYNGAHWLDDLLDSLQAQTITDWKLTWVDDGSTDSTISVMARRAAHDPRISAAPIPVRLPGRGPTPRFLDLLHRSENRWALCDQDDVWQPFKLAVSLAALHQIDSPGVPAAVFTDAVVTDAALRPIGGSAVGGRGPLQPGRVPIEQICLQNRAIGMTMVGNHALANLATSRPDLVDELAMHDWWLATLAAAVGELAYLPTSTTAYRQHGDNASAQWSSWGGSSGVRPTTLGSAAGRRTASAALAERSAAIVGRAARQAAAATQLLGDRTPAPLRRLGGIVGSPTGADLRQLARLGVRMADRRRQFALELGARLGQRPTQPSSAGGER